MSDGTILSAAAVLLLAVAPAWAAPITVHYSTYAAGLTVLRSEATLDLSPERYSLRLDYQTAGAFGFFDHMQFSNRGEGRFHAQLAEPARVSSVGVLHGEQRATVILYRDGQPIVQQLVPPDEREPVPPALARNAIDTLSAIAQLIRQVNQTGRCEMAVRTFDGRRLSELRAWTVGTDLLPNSAQSIYTGPALHCAFEGHLVAGFKTDEPRDSQAKPQHGGAWFAAPTPGGLLIPVRMTFGTPWFGEATMLIDAAN